MIVSMIAAMAHNRVIGKNNKMPWHLPADLKHFKKITTGKSVIMGRLTYESIGKALPNRTNIVISRQSDYELADAKVACSCTEALELASDICDEVMIIGGGTIYQAFLPHAQRLYLTHIDLNIEGDTQFPDYQQHAQWQEISKESFAKDEKNPHNLQFVTLQRVSD